MSLGPQQTHKVANFALTLRSDKTISSKHTLTQCVRSHSLKRFRFRLLAAAAAAETNINIDDHIT